MYAALKLVHVLAVIVFVGNITVGIFWKRIADAAKDPAIISHTIAGIIKADRVFTIPAIVVLLVAGIGTAQAGHWSILGTGWILWSIALFIIAGLAFGPVSRVQRQLRDLSGAAAAGGTMDWALYERLSRRWAVWGTIALVAPLIAVGLMVLKPALHAL